MKSDRKADLQLHDIRKIELKSSFHRKDLREGETRKKHDICKILLQEKYFLLAYHYILRTFLKARRTQIAHACSIKRANSLTSSHRRASVYT